MVIKVDSVGHIHGYGNVRARNPSVALALARQHEANRVLTHAVTGTLTLSGGVAQRQVFNAVPLFVEVDVATGTIGPTLVTLDASLALVNDALDRLFFDANAIAAVLGVAQVVYGGGGTKASPIADITGAGVLANTGPTAANANAERVVIDTNMHTLGALVNKLLRATGHATVLIETSAMRQPPPDTYGAGAPTLPGGTGRAFGTDSPFTDPTPTVSESMDAQVGTGVTKAAADAALDTWRNNVETLATRLSLVTNTVVALTDSSTGTAAAAIVALTALPADVDVSGTVGSTEATLDAEVLDIKNSLASLAFKANALSAGLGGAVVTHDGGGTKSDTLPAIGTSGTAANTSAVKANMDPITALWEKSFDALAEQVNELAELSGSVGVTRVVVKSSFIFDNPVNPQQGKSSMESGNRFLTERLDPHPGATIGADAGAFNATGQLKTDLDALLVEAKDNIATLAKAINAVRTALAGPLIQIV